jgi:hypothetical protein
MMHKLLSQVTGEPHGISELIGQLVARVQLGGWAVRRVSREMWEPGRPIRFTGRRVDEAGELYEGHVICGTEVDGNLERWKFEVCLVRRSALLT